MSEKEHNDDKKLISELAFELLCERDETALSLKMVDALTIENDTLLKANVQFAKDNESMKQRVVSLESELARQKDMLADAKAENAALIKKAIETDIELRLEKAKNETLLLARKNKAKGK